MKTQKEVNAIKNKYKEGMSIKLINMNDPNPIPSDTTGVISHIDDQGTLHMKWENGRTLGLVPGVDEFKILV